MNCDKIVFCPLVYKLYNSKINDRMYNNIDIISGDIVWLAHYEVTGIVRGKTQGLDIIDDVFNLYRKYYVNNNAISFWLPTDFIQKKKMVIAELPIYIKALHMIKITNFIVKYKTLRDIKW